MLAFYSSAGCHPVVDAASVRVACMVPRVPRDAVNLILAELRKQSGELIRDKNRTARAVPLKCLMA